MKAVVNATPLIALARVNRLAILPQLFEAVLVPPAVY
jgi:predicted nucleic acid-binding protein